MKHDTTELTDTKAPEICGAKISKQLNGNSIYVVFEGTEQSITDAYNTLWTANALSGDLEWLNAGMAIVTTTPKQFQKGLLNRALLRLMDNPEACSTFKGAKHGFAAIAQAQAVKLWQDMPQVRVITPGSSFAPYFYKMGYNDPALDEYHGRS